jgi:hypothetical protein
MLLVQVKADALVSEFSHERHQLLQAASDAVYRPGGDHVELAVCGVLAEPVECRALISALGAANAVVRVDLDDVPATLLRNALKLDTLIVCGLSRC